MELFTDNKKKNEKPKENTENLGEISSKIRLLEERYTMLRKKAQMTEQNLISFQKDVDDEIKILNEDLADLKRTVSKIKDQADILLRRIEEFARAEDVKVIAKYIEYINPTKFLTKDEAIKIIKDKINH